MNRPLWEYHTIKCPFCHEKCIGIWKKISSLGLGQITRCPNCQAIIHYGKAVHVMRIVIAIIWIILGIQYIKLYPPKNSFITSNIFVAFFTISELILVRFAKIRYVPDGKHPERIYKKEAQTLYGTMLFYVEDNVLYEQDYVVRVINQEQEVEFRISKDGYKTENVIDLVYNDDRQSIFRIFDHYVTLQTDKMMVSSSFSVN